MDFYHYRVVVYTHDNTFMFKQHVKVSFASDDPFNKTDNLLSFYAEIGLIVCMVLWFYLDLYGRICMAYHLFLYTIIIY